MKRFLSICVFIFFCSCYEQPSSNSLPKRANNLTFFENLNQHFVVEPLPHELLKSIKLPNNWTQFEGSIVYPMLPKTDNLLGFLSGEYGDASNLFLVRQGHAFGGGGHFDILFTLNPETEKLIDQIIIGEESYLTSLRYKTIWVNHLDKYVFHVYGRDKIDSLTVEKCLEEEREATCQQPVSKYIFVDDSWHFQTIKEHKIAKGRLFPFLSNQFLEAHELNSYTKEILELMSAEIYAQYGYSFEKSRLKTHFNQQKWYVPQKLENVDTLFSNFEKHNLEVIRTRVLNTN